MTYFNDDVKVIMKSKAIEDLKVVDAAEAEVEAQNKNRSPVVVVGKQ